ncbi:MAG: phytanoyl-CoA dioxygenase family protein, partial [Mycobacterium sp.]
MELDDQSVTLEDLKGDLALRYKWKPSSGAAVDPALVEADMAALDRDGYVIWENLLNTEQCRQIREVVRP